MAAYYSLTCIKIHWVTRQNSFLDPTLIDSDLVGLKSGPRTVISNKLPDDTSAASLKITL